jgi:hypothetical protein
MTNQPTKTQMFFSLIRSVYGAGKYSQQWPTDLDVQAAQALWGQEIEKHSEEELKAAIDNAQRLATNGNQAWQWPNIGLILSGAKRHGTAAHKIFLPEPEREIIPATKRSELARSLLKDIF